jgi:hypothetical protein
VGIVTDFVTGFRKCYVEFCWLFQSFTEFRLVARSTRVVKQDISATCFTYGEKTLRGAAKKEPAKLSSQNRVIKIFLLA